MKNIKIIMSGFALLFATSQLSVQSQTKGLAMGSEYDFAVGLRAGETSGLTMKRSIGSAQYLEGIIGIWNHGLSFTLLYERTAPAFGVSGLNWYYGAGAHAAVKNRYYFSYYDRGRYYYYQYSNLGIGIDGIAGIEYKIPKTPLALSLDVKPYLEIVSGGGIWSSIDPGFGIKLTF